MPVEVNSDILSQLYGLDDRTVHLLPARCPEHPHPTPLPSTHPPLHTVVHNQAWQGMSNHYSSGAASSGTHNYISTPYWRRYAAILEKNRVRYFAKVVIQEDLEPWAKKRGFTILRQNRFYGSVNEKLEKTEFSRSGSK